MRFTRKQLKAIEILALAHGDLENKELAKLIGCSEGTLLSWKRKPEFIDEVVKRARQLVREKLPKIYSVLTDKAEDGEYQHIKLVLTHFEKLEELQSKANEGSINFTWRLPEGIEHESVPEENECTSLSEEREEDV
jgi:hypothetical protein